MSPDSSLPRLSTAQWIREVDQIRANDELLRRGYWHGYTADPLHAPGTPMKGYYYLVRWEQPTIAISHDDRNELIDLAHGLEEALRVGP